MAVNSTSSTPTAPSTSFARRDRVGTGMGGRIDTNGLLQSRLAVRIRGHGSVDRGGRAGRDGPGATPGFSLDNAPGSAGFPAVPLGDSFPHGRARPPTGLRR